MKSNIMEYEKIISQLEDKQLLRALKSVQSIESGHCISEDRQMLNLSSNDYLGITTNKQLTDEFHKELLDHPDWLIGGSASSRLLTGNHPLYDELELSISEWYDQRKVLFYNSGYHANLGILPALTEKKDLILSDKLCHASIIDGIRLSSASHIRYRHNDYDHLRTLLAKYRKEYNNVFIVSESIFSMDGDEANLSELVLLKEEYGAFLYLDEAHAVGAIGSKGRGLAEEKGLLSKIDILVCPMGKAMASVGAFVITTDMLHKILVNKSRTLIFTTALPPINLAWSLFVVNQMPTLVQLRNKLSSLCAEASQLLNQKTRHIIPILVGENKVAVELANHMQRKGFLTFPIRPPTVPKGRSRLRISLTANIELTELRTALTELTKQLTHK